MTATRAVVTLHGPLLSFRKSFMADNQGAEDTLLTLTADIVAAHVSNNSVAVNDLPNLIQNVHSALSGISHTAAAPEARPEPKASIRSAAKRDSGVCLDRGKRQNMLTRPPMPNRAMNPDQSRQRRG